MIDGTLTFDMKPSGHLPFRLEGRFDSANEPLSQKGSSDSSSLQGRLTLGVVATTQAM